MSRSAPAQAAPEHPVPIDRRRLLGAVAGGALLAGLQTSTTLAQPATPASDHPEALASLSQRLCGGGVFAPTQVTQLAELLAGDATLSAGLGELLEAGFATPAPASRSASAQSAAQTILLFWYTGDFQGEPIANHAAVYPQLQAWQAMYTPAWTTCKAYGAWADPPAMTPQQPENA
ncbi:MAG: hypothetical protein KC442_12190 [Thermomicrobiales bacterium]|nr:hypothetical protein [Thermomicrobiales bacterium]